MYHYAANNPVRYTDPDGEASVYSYKIGPDEYGVKTDLSSLEDIIESLTGFIPRGGSLVCSIIYKATHKALGYKKIDEEKAWERLMSTSSESISFISDLYNIADITGLTKFFGNNVNRIGNFLGKVSILTAGRNLYKNCRDAAREARLNYVVYFLLRKHLISNSHENVSALFVYAKQRIRECVENGTVSFEVSTFGSSGVISWNLEEIKKIKQELDAKNEELKGK